MDIKNKIPYIGFVLVLGLFCFMQVYSICELFFSYPTVILSEVNFDVNAIPVPTMTFCIYIGNRTNGTTSEEIFKTLNILDIVQSFEYHDAGSGKSYNIFNPDESSLSLSMEYNCLTLKNLHQGKLNFIKLYLNYCSNSIRNRIKSPR